MDYVNKDTLERMKDTDKMLFSVPKYIEQVTLYESMKDEFRHLKSLAVPRATVMKYNKGLIDLDQMRLDYFRQLEAIQPQGVVNFLKYKLLVCDCGKRHSKSCHSILLKEFIAKKNFKLKLISKESYKRAIIEL